MKIKNNFLVILIMIVMLFFPSGNVFATASISMSPTTGNSGTSVTVSGTGFTDATQNTVGLGTTGFTGPENTGGVFTEDFSSLPPNSPITYAAVGIQNLENGTYNPVLGGTTYTVTESTGVISAQEFVGLLGEGTITQAALGISSGSGYLRLKVYDDTGASGKPGNLLGESSSNAIVAGLNYISVNATIPADGNVYLAWELLNSTNPSNIVLQFTEPGGGIAYNILHTYGPGPNPFGTPYSTSTVLQWYEGIKYTTTLPHIRMKIYDDSASGKPGNLLGESASTQINSTGLTYIPVSATIPADGNVYVAFETDKTVVFYLNVISGYTSYDVGHTYGPGPNPFGTAFSVPSDQWYESLEYNHPTPTITLKWDGSTLSTTPSSPITSTTGTFNNVIFNVPSANAGTHTVNASDSSGLFATATFSVTAYTVQLRPTLNDNSTQLTSARVIDTNSSATETLTANYSGWVKFTNLVGLQNFTVIDDKNFVVDKIINKNISSAITQNLQTNDMALNCIGTMEGYQSDFIIRINDTDGTHITGFTPVKCPYPNFNKLSFDVTFAANGNSASTFSSSMITTVTNQVYKANPLNFTENGNTIKTIWTGVNIISNPFTVGSGLTTETLDFIVDLATTQSTSSGGQSGGTGNQNYFTSNSNCFASVYNPATQTCLWGQVGINATSNPVVVNPTSSNTTTINIQCQGAPYLTITNVNLGSNPLGFQIVGLPTNVNCGNTSTPSTCPQGSTLQSGQCVTLAVCPLSSQLSNGQCVGTLTCQSGATLQNGQCIIPATCANGIMPVGGICPVNGAITVQAPQENSSSTCSINNPSACVSNSNNSCSIANLLACTTGSSQSEPATLTAVSPNGQVESIKTVLTAITNPELNNVSLVMILLIIAAIIGGVAYRYVIKKEKSSVKRSRGKKNNIEKFNSELRKK